MSRSLRIEAQSSKHPVIPISANQRTATPRASTPFDGTIASACQLLGVTLEWVIEMMFWARESEPKVAQFLDVWWALSPVERDAAETADTVRKQVGLQLLPLLEIVATVSMRLAMLQVQIISAATLPSVVDRSIDVALTDKGVADRKMLLQHAGFLPSPHGPQTIIGVSVQNTQATAAVPSVTAPRPEDTIRRATNRFNDELISRPSPPLPGGNK